MQLSIAQIETKLNDKKFNLEKMERFMYEARRGQSDLVIFPELCLTGDSIGPWLKEAAESIQGESIQYLQGLCEKLKINAVISFPEYHNEMYYVTAAYISDSGNVEATYRKTHLYSESQRYFTQGEEISTFQTKFGTIGMMSCYDLEFPEVARILSRKGADIILIPTSNMLPYKEHQRIYTQCRAMENEVAIVLCNRIGKEGDLEFIGYSTVVDAQGETHLLLSNQEELGTLPLLLFKRKDSKLNDILNGNPLLFKELSKVHPSI